MISKPEDYGKAFFCKWFLINAFTMYWFNWSTHFYQFCSFCVQNTVIQKHVTCNTRLFDWWAIDRGCSCFPFQIISRTSFNRFCRRKWCIAGHSINPVKANKLLIKKSNHPSIGYVFQEINSVFLQNDFILLYQRFPVPTLRSLP